MSINSKVDASHGTDGKSAMDRMYRLQRHIYDLTRAYYLLGRDQMIADLNPPANGSVLEMGCGTGRNLVHAAKLYPQSQFYGFDLSDEMLKTATAAIARHGLTKNVRLAQGDATRFDAHRVFGRKWFDRVFFSYTLSMIPDWQSALLQAARLVAPGGELHVVDFGSCDALPSVAKAGLYRWLSLFDVTPRQDLALAAEEVARNVPSTPKVWQTHSGYVVRLHMVRD